MDQESSFLAAHIKDARQRKGYTQQELSDRTGVSIRSVQRIENGEVIPRGYTLRLLAEQLDLQHLLNGEAKFGPISGETPGAPGSSPTAAATPREPAYSPTPAQRDLHRPGKIILTAGIAIFLLLAGLAFISQSPRFPETDFEGFCFWAVVTVLYTAILFRIWK